MKVAMAARRLLEIARTMWLDLRFSGCLLRGNVPTRFSSAGAFHTVNSDYEALARMFAGRIRPWDVLVDVGCGKGRVINWWLSQGLGNEIFGLELDPDIAAATARRFARYANVHIRCGDAVAELPPSASLLYLYNPFDAAVMLQLKAALAGRNVVLVYYNPEFVHLFESDPSWEVRVYSLGLPGNCHRYAVVTR